MKSAHSYSKTRLSVLVNPEEVWFTNGGLDNSDVERSGQVTLNSGKPEIEFRSEGEGEYFIIQTRVTNGYCVDIGKYPMVQRQ